MTIENHNTPAPEERELSEDQQFERMVHDDDSGLFDAGVQMAAPREGVADVDAQPDDLLEKDDQDEGGGHIGEKGENGHQATDDQRVSDDAGGG